MGGGNGSRLGPHSITERHGSAPTPTERSNCGILYETCQPLVSRPARPPWGVRGEIRPVAERRSPGRTAPVGAPAASRPWTPASGRGPPMAETRHPAAAGRLVAPRRPARPGGPHVPGRPARPGPCGPVRCDAEPSADPASPPRTAPPPAGVWTAGRCGVPPRASGRLPGLPGARRSVTAVPLLSGRPRAWRGRPAGAPYGHRAAVPPGRETAEAVPGTEGVSERRTLHRDERRPVTTRARSQ